ncbi:pyocin activator PrtN family protein [uncultured Shewanella sp.]|uniref:pyocin activator PrtN family protein n=1 Tax=uncultured Shewanella sp. TaxID=173975 RepID=UPI0026165BEA|nr:pyocin activator PrtN family protein [uncultured Shewanella sp.]
MTQTRTASPQTLLLLMAEYGQQVLIPLEQICEKVFHMSIKTANRKANASELPLPAVRLSDSQKSPYMVSIQDLALYIEDRCTEARIEWGKRRC